jgi:hypothetical protein
VPRLIRNLPFLKLLAVLQVLLLARRHLHGLSRDDRRRMVELTRRGHRLSRSERRELRELAMKLEPRAFVTAAAKHLAPVPFPGRRRR